MCTLAIYRNAFEGYPVVVAANRDENYARRATVPGPVDALPGVRAGRDAVAGGTWLGVRMHAPFLLAAVLNRRAAGVPAPSPAGALSRGHLCLGCLEGTQRVEEALSRLRRERLDAYGPFNLVLADADRAVVVDNTDGMSATELGEGLTVVTNLRANDRTCPRLAGALPKFAALIDEPGVGTSFETLTASLAAVLSDHRADDPSPYAPLCVHTEAYGTRSSSVVALGADGRVRYAHAEGAPCRNRFEEID